MRVEVKIYDDEGNLRTTVTANPQEVELEDVYEEPNGLNVFSPSSVIRNAPKRTELIVHLKKLTSDSDGVQYRLVDEMLSKQTSSTQDGVVDFVLVPAKDKNDRHEVMLFECNECHKLFNTIQLLPHTIEHGGRVYTTDIRAILPAEENNT